MALLSRTIAVFSKMVDDVKKILHVVTIIVSCIFLSYYAYSVVINLERLVYLVIYSLFFAIALATFIIYLVTYAEKSDKAVKLKRVFRIIKYVLHAAMLCVNAYEIATVHTSDLNVILLAVSAVSLIAQIIIELIGVFAERYVKLLKTALEKDLEFFRNLAKLKDKSGILDLIDTPLEAIANKLQNKEPDNPSKEEEYVDGLAEEYEAKKQEFAADQRLAEQLKNAENAEKKKTDIKEHFSVIRDKVKEKVADVITKKRDQ